MTYLAQNTKMVFREKNDINLKIYTIKDEDMDKNTLKKRKIGLESILSKK